MIDRLVQLFPLWALLGVAAAYSWPGPFEGLGSWIGPLLGLIMLGMGLTLTPGDFLRAVRRPGFVLLGLGLQFSVMPLAAWAVGLALNLDPVLLVGLILVGAAPGGTASNIVTYLARGDVALSITLTTVSTLVAIVLTPLLTWLLAGHRITVPAWEMLETMILIILLPVAVGTVVNTVAGRHRHALVAVFPLISLAALVLILMVIFALNRAQLEILGLTLFLAVLAHNAIGLAAGYGASRLFGADRRTARTLAIEVGMQNSGLAVALAAKFFPAAAALPGAIFSIWHNLSGAALAGFWRRGSATDIRPGQNRAKVLRGQGEEH
ncbi:MAG: bile acid:sodium symporter family protein [Alphaproteobacteria bacterium]